MMELKIYTFWLSLVGLTYILAKLHFILSRTNLNWKYFKDDYSYFGIAHGVILYIGIIAISVHLFILITNWWFNQLRIV